MLPFLSGLTFEILGFPENRQQELSDWITEAEGDLVYIDHEGRVDYLVVPITGFEGKSRSHKHLVTDLWLEDCLDSNNGSGQLLPVEFHYKPVGQVAGAPLEGVVACLSGYGGKERDFLAHLVGALGGLSQEIFAKRDNAEKKVRGSTHLICPEASGNKYAAGMKWKLPIISKDWVRACFKDKTWVSEKNFLIGESKAVTEGKPEPSEHDEEEEMEEEDTVTTMTEDEIQRSHGQPSTTPQHPRASIPVLAQATTPVTPLAAMRVNSPATAVRLPARPQVESPMVELNPQGAARSAAINTPLGQGVDSPMATQSLKPKPINLTDITVTPQRWADSQPSPGGEGSSSKRRRSEDESRASCRGMATPTTPYGSHFTPNPTPKTRKYFKSLAGAMPKPELTELEQRQMEQFANLRPEGSAGQQDGVDGETEDAEKMEEEEEKRHQEALDLMESRGLPVLERDSRPFDEVMEEHYQKQGKSWKTFSQDAAARARAKLEAMETDEVEQEEEQNKVLEGVTVAVARKLINQAEEVQKVVKDLGGKVSHQMDETVTHLVFRGQQNDKTKEFRTAREAGVFVVAPDWVFMCRDEGRKVEEELFPHTFNPRKKLDITGSSPPLSITQSQPRSASSRKRKVDVKAVAPVSLAMSQISQMSDMEEEVEEKNEEESLVSKEVSGDLEAMASLLGSRSGTPINSNRKVLRTKLSNQEEKTRTPKAAKDEDDDLKGEEEKKSQVLWVDPDEEEARRKLKEQVSALETQDLDNMVTMNTMDTMGITAMEEEDKENRRNRSNSFVFMVSSLDEQQLVQLEEGVAKLGGRMSSNASNFDPEATHMITGKVGRSEKVMSSVASGRWLLHPSYIVESLAQGRWLEEERFEWGNELNGFLDVQMKTKEGKESAEVKLALAARHWRLQGPGSSAFSGFQVLILSKRSSFDRRSVNLLISR